MIGGSEMDPESQNLLTDQAATADAVSRGLAGDFSDTQNGDDMGPNLYAASEFENAFRIPGSQAAIKISGYVKADLIYDFDPIDSEDFFDTTTIPVDAAPRTNTRFHARQSRLNFDARWPTRLGTARAYFEADFFGQESSLRFRHAYGELRSLIIGQTWTTFADMAAIPNTLDFEGAVSSISRRQAQVRWTQPLPLEGLALAVAVEDPRVIVDKPPDLPGDPRTPSPDFIGRLRLTRGWGQFQMAGIVRQLGFQMPDAPVKTVNAWGFNFTGALEPTRCDKVYYQVLFGDGIGSYKGLPDIVGLSTEASDTLPVFGWMIGWTHQWNQRWTSNFTYSENRIDNRPFQPADDLRENTYFALNLICNPVKRVYCGVEYLFGTRENVDGSRGEANRLQMSFIFELP
jgi:hypothetical protein